MLKALVPAVCFAVLTAAACTQDAGALSIDVGGPCEGDSECSPDSFCKEGKFFPDGMCSIECEEQQDCIDSTVCTTDKLCLMVCNRDEDCREGYSCIPQDRTQDLEPVKVCANAPVY